jgi:glucose/mannose-6-phosphate isomerase
MNLNDTSLFKQVDQSNMLAYIDALPEQFRQAWQAAATVDMPDGYEHVRQIVICGMGGSAISGSLAASLFEGLLDKPVISVRGYDLPAYAKGDHTLVVAMSHSGTTEETLSCAQQAIEREAKLLAVTTGGELAPLIAEAGGALLRYTYDAPPRAALGWLYGSLLGGLHALGIIPDIQGEVDETIRLLDNSRSALQVDVSTGENRAKRLAGQLIDRVPVIWAAGLLNPVARRWKTQLNENAKSAAYFETLPELNHNSVVGIEYPEGVLIGRFCPVQLRSSHEHKRVTIRHEATKELLLGYGIVADEVRAHGVSRLAQQMNLVQFGDYVSYYLAIAYQVDPTPIDTIITLKQRLAEA